MLAKPIPEMLVVRQAAIVDGVRCALVDCKGFDHYQSLPAVIEIDSAGVSHRLGKTGWNSDSHYCSYQSNAIMARSVG